MDKSIFDNTTPIDMLISIDTWLNKVSDDDIDRIASQYLTDSQFKVQDSERVMKEASYDLKRVSVLAILAQEWVEEYVKNHGGWDYIDKLYELDQVSLRLKHDLQHRITITDILTKTREAMIEEESGLLENNGFHYSRLTRDWQLVLGSGGNPNSESWYEDASGEELAGEQAIVHEEKSSGKYLN